MPRYELVDGSSSKFWEIALAGKSFTTTYGRIGAAGQSTTKTWASEAQARKEHDKLVAEKTRKGYVLVGGGRGAKKKTAGKKTATRKAAARRGPAASASGAKKKTKKKPAARKAPARKKAAAKPGKKALVPIKWRFKTDTPALGIYVDHELSWVGNEGGEVFAVTPSGEVRAKFKLPQGVKCLIADEAWRYAGCNDGSVYDLTGRVPRLVYKVSKTAQILWLDIFRGNLVVSDDEGGLTVVDAEDQLRWKRRAKGHGNGWMVRADASGIYHGHDGGVTKYDWDGNELWRTKEIDGILFGWQEPDAVYACCDGVKSFDKTSGELLVSYQSDDFLPACAASPGGELVFATDCMDMNYCWAADGTRQWKLQDDCGGALSMQYFAGDLYVVTSDGYLACIDTSEQAIARATAGQRQAIEERRAPQVEAVASTTLETTSDATQGVVVECVKEGSKLRVRVVSPGYQRDWFCQFPKDIRKAGQRYVVDQVREATQGGFYRVLGDIKQLT